MLAAIWKHKGKFIYIQMTCPHSLIENLICTRHCSSYFNVKVHVELPNLLQKLISLICSCYGMNWNWTLWDGGGEVHLACLIMAGSVSKITGLEDYEKYPWNSQ